MNGRNATEGNPNLIFSRDCLLERHPPPLCSSCDCECHEESRFDPGLESESAASAGEAE